MGCGYCGSGSGPSTKWELTTTSGDTRVFLTEVEARVAATASGGGTIRPIT
ncbi:MAG: hypothetical protein U1C73_03160 [Dietzia sp.]|nr:hypothetical protein [Dietzia sp.]